MLKRSIQRLTGLSALLALAACGGGGGAEGGGGMSIVSCSLGCATTTGGTISCGVNQVFVNQQISVEFSQPIDPDSLNPFSFRVISETGSSPSGEYSVDPNNPRRAVFRPLVTFGSDGLPEFGLDEALDYTVSVPAFQAGSLGFIVESQGGSPNTTPLSCSVRPSLGIKDIVPGQPTVTTFVEEIEKTFSGGELVSVEVLSSTDILEVQPGVSPSSRLRFVFDDVMNPAALVNTVTQSSDFIEVRVDIDGVLTDNTDQLTIPGTFSLNIDQSAGSPSTTVIFTPLGDFPTAGVQGAGLPRQIVIVLPPQITDLGGNALANFGQVSFITTTQPSAIEEQIRLTFSEATNKSDFTTARVDPLQSGMLLDFDYTTTDGPTTFDGRLLRPLGGGSGRLGALRVGPFEEVVLSTGPDIPTVFGPELVTGPVLSGDDVVAYHVRTQIVDDGLYPIDPFPDVNGNEWFEDGILDNGPGTTDFTVADGVFEFSSLEIQAGGRLKVVGANPGRIFVRGAAVIDGLVQAEGAIAPSAVDALGELAPGASGAQPGEDTDGSGAADAFGQMGAAGGPGGGAGGQGGDRSYAPLLVGVGPTGATVPAPGGAFPWKLAGELNPPVNGIAFEVLDDPDTQISIDGRAGEGRGGALPGPGGDFGAGQPASRFPLDFPGQSDPPTDPLTDFAGLVFSNFCESIQFAAGGTGGSFSAPGGKPQYIIPPGLPALGGVVEPNIPDPSTALLLAFEQELDPERPGGQLVGGSGGGGGGTGAAYCRTSGLPFNCGIGNPSIGGGVLQLLDFFDGRGAGGGGGGGAIQIQAGNILELNGTISVRGGRGGGLSSNAPPERGAVAPGGGGSGGALLLQTTVLDLASFPGILDVSGGDGGRTSPTGSVGGLGSPGILQVENGSSLAALGPVFTDFAEPELLGLTSDPLAFDQGGQPVVGARVAPTLSFTGPTQEGGPFLFSDVLETGGWTPNTTGPGASFGMQTCWLVPETSAFSVEFEGDVLDVDDNIVEFGWDLKLEAAGLDEVLSYRGPIIPQLSFLTGGKSIEVAGGNQLGASPIVVRFQGARAIEPIDDPCQVFLSGPASVLLPGSVTPWLTTPEEVSLYWQLLSDANPFADVNDEVSPDRQVSPGVAVQRQANIIRVQVIVDGTAFLGDTVLSVVELELKALLN